MEKFQATVSNILHANLDLLAVKITEASAGNAYTRGEQLNVQGMRQMVEALVNIIDEALEGSSSESFQTFVDSVVPSLVRHGRDATSFSYTCVVVSICIAHVLERELPAPFRDEATAWFARFFARFTAEVVQAANKAA